MKQWLVISGKGGTGKTCVTAALAVLAENKVLADCDVDAADLHLLTQPKTLETHEFYAGIMAAIDPARCTNCGLCQQLCKFNAINEKIISGKAVMQIDETACEGCNVCYQFCPEKAVVTRENHCGTWYLSDTRFGQMVHARLFPGAENSGKLVSTVRKETEKQAGITGCNLALIDGPPGVGCPVIASLTGVDLAILVTEPSPSGRHDLKRVLELTQFLEVPAAVVINKWDLNEEFTKELEADLISDNVFMAGRVRYDANMYNALVEEKSVIEYTSAGAAEDLLHIWSKLKKRYLEN